MDVDEFVVRARWDAGSKSWWTDGEDIPGLCCQAASFEELVEVVLDLAPELLGANCVVPGDRPLDIPITIVAERRATARIAA